MYLLKKTVHNKEVALVNVILVAGQLIIRNVKREWINEAEQLAASVDYKAVAFSWHIVCGIYGLRYIFLPPFSSDVT